MSLDLDTDRGHPVPIGSAQVRVQHCTYAGHAAHAEL